MPRHETGDRFAEAVALSSAAKGQHLYFGPFELRADGTLLRNSTVLSLPPKELAVLRSLLAKAGQIVSNGELQLAGWGYTHVSADSLPRCISSLRARLDGANCIATVYKRGYRFEMKITSPVDTLHGSDSEYDGRFTLANPARVGGLAMLGDSATGAALPNAWGMSHGHDGVFSQNASWPASTGPNWMPMSSLRMSQLPRLVFFPFRSGVDVPDGMGTSIVDDTMLRLSRARVRVVDVLASSSVVELASRGLTALEVGFKLGANLALAGTITAQPMYFRLRAEMFRVDNGVQIWVEDFSVPRELLSIADMHMSRLISARIGTTLVKSPINPALLTPRVSAMGTFGGAVSYEFLP